jgi:hypothetical protein
VPNFHGLTPPTSRQSAQPSPSSRSGPDLAAAAGAFYFILPQLAQVSSSWQALQSAHWAWLPVIIAASALTYLASAAALIGAVPGPVPFWPATLTQAASSFVNRVSPANVGGMAVNAGSCKIRVPPEPASRQSESTP